METRTTLSQVVRQGSSSHRVRVVQRDGVLCVPWSYIIQLFPKAHTANDAGIAVPFLEDDNGEVLKPFRLEYQEGCVWDIVDLIPPTQYPPSVSGSDTSPATFPANGPIESPISLSPSGSGDNAYDDIHSQWQSSHTWNYGSAHTHGNRDPSPLNYEVDQSQPISYVQGPQSYPVPPISPISTRFSPPGHSALTVPFVAGGPNYQTSTSSWFQSQEYEPHGLNTTNYTPPPRNTAPLPAPASAPDNGRQRNLTINTQVHGPHTSPPINDFYGLPSAGILSPGTEGGDVLVSRTIMTSAIARASGFHTQTLEVLTKNLPFSEQPSPRLFVVLGDKQATTPQSQHSGSHSTNGQEKFQLYFLCECGGHTRPLDNTGLNQVHFVDQNGYEITKPGEFFRKYGAFIKYFSSIIKSGISYNTTKVESLDGLNRGLQLLQNQFSAKSWDWQYLEYAINAQWNLDKELEAMIEYLHILEDSGEFLGFQALDGTDIRSLLAYVDIPKDHLGSPGSLYRICTDEGYGKWVCKAHYQQTLTSRAVRGFMTNVQELKWPYSRRLGKAKITFKTPGEASVFYKCIQGLESLFEADIGLNWTVSTSDLRDLKAALSFSKVVILSLKVDELASVTESQQCPPVDLSRLQCLRLWRIPLCALIKPLDRVTNLKAIQLDYVDRDYSSMSLLSKFSGMVELSIPGRQIGDNGLEILCRNSTKALRIIDFSQNGITDKGGCLLARTLYVNKGITSLNLSHNYLGDTTVARIIKQLGSRLLTLGLSAVGFGVESARSLKEMLTNNFPRNNSAAQLECLDLSGTAWELEMLLILIEIIGWMHTGGAISSEELDTAAAFVIANLMAQPIDTASHESGQCNAILTTGNYERAQKSLIDFSRIRSLRLRDSCVLEDSAAHLIGMMDMGSVTKLELNRLKQVFQPKNVDLVLENVFKDSSDVIDHLQISNNNRVRAPATMELSGTILSRLSHLDMHGTEAGDTAAKILASQLFLRSCKLEFIDLSGNRITSQGVGAIINALRINHSVTTIYMGRQNVPFSTSSATEPQVELMGFLNENRTVRQIYLPSASIKELKVGLPNNESIQVLLLDHWEGTYDDAGELGPALGQNKALMHLKIFGGQKINPNKDLPQSLQDGNKSDMAKYFIRKVVANTGLQELEWPDFLMGERIPDWPRNGVSSYHIPEKMEQTSGAQLRRGPSIYSTISSLSAGSSNSGRSISSGYSSIQTNAQQPGYPPSMSSMSVESGLTIGGNLVATSPSNGDKSKQGKSGFFGRILGGGETSSTAKSGKVHIRKESMKNPRDVPLRR